jgi:hypothetical protein
MTTYKALSNGEGHSRSSAKKREDTPNETVELGALRLTEDEVVQFEKWATEPSSPTEFMLEAARVHKALQLKLRR